MCLADKKVRNHEANKLRAQVSESLQNLHSNIEDLVKSVLEPSKFARVQRDTIFIPPRTIEKR